MGARDARTGAPDEWAPTGVPTYPRALPTSKKVGKFSWEKPLEINWGNLEYEKLEKHWENWKWGNYPRMRNRFCRVAVQFGGLMSVWGRP